MNFSYLKDLELPKGLYEACREAELFAKSFPAVSISSARRAGEFTVKLVYATLISNLDIYSKSAYEMLTELSFSGQIPESSWFDSAHMVRMSGNRASHQGVGMVQDALEILKALHYEVGYSLKLLHIANENPAFDDRLVPESAGEPIPKSEIELELETNYLNALRSVGSIMSASTASRPQATKSKDSGANSKAALNSVAQFLHKQKPNWTVLVSAIKGTIAVTLPSGKSIIITVKSGCPSLGKRINGVLEILPGVSYVLYAPNFSPNQSFVEQLYVFSKDAFLAMWKKLGLIRTKVSKATSMRLRKELGPDAIISTEIYADMISVQSFSNSGKKTKLLAAELEKAPLLMKDGLSIIERAEQ